MTMSKIEKLCFTCKHYPSDEYCKGCILNLMKSNGNTNWNLKVLEPKEPFINKPCISEGVCHEDKMKVLEKIRKEIESIAYEDFTATDGEGGFPICNLPEVLAIIDKYMAESEDE